MNSYSVLFTLPITVPSSPPQNVVVISVNPRSLIVSWQPPPQIDHNGELTDYIIQYTMEGSNMTNEEFTSDTIITIEMLSGAYVNYLVQVAAVTVNGTGPFSDPIVQVSGQDSMLSCKSVYS